MLNILNAVGSMMSGQVNADALQNIMGMVQGHMADNNAQTGNTDALAAMVAEKLGLDSGMVQAVMPQLMQVVQNGQLQAMLDNNQDGQVNVADLMSLMGK